VVELIREVGQRGHVDDHDIAVGLDRSDVARLDVVHHVDLAGLETL
jgi:hypothetical protein